MELDKAVFHLRSIGYKPNHTLRWVQVATNTLEVYWEFERPDCLDPSEWGVGRSGPEILYLPHIYTREQLVRKIFAMTLRLEEHEAREFFTFGVLRPFDPHRNLIDEHGRYDDDHREDRGVDRGTGRTPSTDRNPRQSESRSG